jgi:hypothetical protein
MNLYKIIYNLFECDGDDDNIINENDHKYYLKFCKCLQNPLFNTNRYPLIYDHKWSTGYVLMYHIVNYDIPMICHSTYNPISNKYNISRNCDIVILETLDINNETLDINDETLDNNDETLDNNEIYIDIFDKNDKYRRKLFIIDVIKVHAIASMINEYSDPICFFELSNEINNVIIHKECINYLPFSFSNVPILPTVYLPYAKLVLTIYDNPIKLPLVVKIKEYIIDQKLCKQIRNLDSIKLNDATFCSYGTVLKT